MYQKNLGCDGENFSVRMYLSDLIPTPHNILRNSAILLFGCFHPHPLDNVWEFGGRTGFTPSPQQGCSRALITLLSHAPYHVLLDYERPRIPRYVYQPYSGSSLTLVLIQSITCSA